MAVTLISTGGVRSNRNKKDLADPKSLFFILICRSGPRYAGPRFSVIKFTRSREAWTAPTLIIRQGLSPARVAQASLPVPKQAGSLCYPNFATTRSIRCLVARIPSMGSTPWPSNSTPIEPLNPESNTIFIIRS